MKCIYLLTFLFPVMLSAPTTDQATSSASVATTALLINTKTTAATVRTATKKSDASETIEKLKNILNGLGGTNFAAHAPAVGTRDAMIAVERNSVSEQSTLTPLIQNTNDILHELGEFFKGR